MLGGAALLRRRFLRWGATTGEQHRSLVGDDILPAPDVSTTRAITITAAATEVWPWLAQLGQGRGGFYSYDWLENVVAHIDIHNVDRIVPQWQHVDLGDEVRLAPEVPLLVVALEQGRALVLRGNVPMGGPHRRTTSPGPLCSSRKLTQRPGCWFGNGTHTRARGPH